MEAKYLMKINPLFKYESVMAYLIFLVPVVMAFVIAVVLPEIMAPTEVDICLDSGGSFNYETCSCDYDKTHKVLEKHTCEK